jgi:hypothetical protein
MNITAFEMHPSFNLPIVTKPSLFGIRNKTWEDLIKNKIFVE